MMTLARHAPDRRRHPASEGAAFSLVEVVVALAVFAFSIPILVAILPVGLDANRFSQAKTSAVDLCSSIESDLRATPAAAAPGTVTLSPLYQIPIPPAPTTAASAPTPTTSVLYDVYSSAGGTTTFSTPSPLAVPAASSQYRFTITVTPSATNYPNDTAIATIVATWPPQLDPTATTTTNKVSVCVAINRVKP